MKILFTPSDNNLAGAFQSMVRLCKILKDDFDCEILVLLRKNGIGQKLLEEEGIPYKKIKSFNWIVPDKPKTMFRKIELIVRTVTKPLAKLYNLYAINKIEKLIKEEKIDIVHLNTTYIYVSAVAALKCDIPIVWHLREFLEEDQKKRIWNRNKGYNLISKANTIVTISESLYEKYKKLLPDANILKIYNGIDEKYYADKHHKIFKDEKLHILMVGTINESKGQLYAIKACKELMDQGNIDFEFNILGEITHYANNLKKLVCKLGLEKNIKFVGQQRDTVKFYKNSDIVLVCSRFEAFGRVTVEAMMAGCLVIGANTGGTTELIQDNVTGFLYKSGDETDLANKIILANKNRINSTKIAENGRNYMLNHMTAYENAKRVYSVYKKILNKDAENE